MDSCPSSPPTFTGNLTQTITVYVVIQGSAPLWGFDVWVRADQSVLNATGVANLGDVLLYPGSPGGITTHCINGFSAGNPPCGQGVVEGSGDLANGATTPNPTTGLLFSINYKVLGKTNSTSITFVTGTGCTSTSVSNTCVTVYSDWFNNYKDVDQETIQTAVFSNPNAVVQPPPPPPPPPGLVCFSAVPTGCPSTPATFVEAVGSNFTVYVDIQGSAAFNGFNIWSRYDPSILNATSVSLAGSILPGATTQFECINGKGSSGCKSWPGNGPGIVALQASGNASTATPTTGLLFSITYKVITTSVHASSSLSSFCVTTPSGPWLLNCAGVYNGGASVSENVQGATVTTTYQGDASKDGTVNIIDLALVGSHFGRSSSQPGYMLAADVNQDGVIDVRDLAVVGTQFGKS